VSTKQAPRPLLNIKRKGTIKVFRDTEEGGEGEGEEDTHTRRLSYQTNGSHVSSLSSIFDRRSLFQTASAPVSCSNLPLERVIESKRERDSISPKRIPASHNMPSAATMNGLHGSHPAHRRNSVGSKSIRSSFSTASARASLLASRRCSYTDAELAQYAVQHPLPLSQQSAFKMAACVGALPIQRGSAVECTPEVVVEDVVFHSVSTGGNHGLARTHTVVHSQESAVQNLLNTVSRSLQGCMSPIPLGPKKGPSMDNLQSPFEVEEGAEGEEECKMPISTADSPMSPGGVRGYFHELSPVCVSDNIDLLSPLRPAGYSMEPGSDGSYNANSTHSFSSHSSPEVNPSYSFRDSFQGSNPHLSTRPLSMRPDLSEPVRGESNKRLFDTAHLIGVQRAEVLETGRWSVKIPTINRWRRPEPYNNGSTGSGSNHNGSGSEDAKEAEFDDVQDGKLLAPCRSASQDGTGAGGELSVCRSENENDNTLLSHKSEHMDTIFSMSSAAVHEYGEVVTTTSSSMKQRLRGDVIPPSAPMLFNDSNMQDSDYSAYSSPMNRSTIVSTPGDDIPAESQETSTDQKRIHPKQQAQSQCAVRTVKAALPLPPPLHSLLPVTAVCGTVKGTVEEIPAVEVIKATPVTVTPVAAPLPATVTASLAAPVAVPVVITQTAVEEKIVVKEEEKVVIKEVKRLQWVQKKVVPKVVEKAVPKEQEKVVVLKAVIKEEEEKVVPKVEKPMQWVQKKVAPKVEEKVVPTGEKVVPTEEKVVPTEAKVVPTEAKVVLKVEEKVVLKVEEKVVLKEEGKLPLWVLKKNNLSKATAPTVSAVEEKRVETKMEPRVVSSRGVIGLWQQKKDLVEREKVTNSAAAGDASAVREIGRLELVECKDRPAFLKDVKSEIKTEVKGEVKGEVKKMGALELWEAKKRAVKEEANKPKAVAIWEERQQIAHIEKVADTPVKEVRVVKRLDAFPVKEKAAAEEEVEHTWVKRSPAVSCVGTPERTNSKPVSVVGSPDRIQSKAVSITDCIPSRPVSCAVSPAVSCVASPQRSPSRSRAVTPTRTTPVRSPAKPVSSMATPENYKAYTINFSDFDSTMMTPSILMSPACEVEESSAGKVESPMPVDAGEGGEGGDDESDDGSITVIMDKTWRMEESMDGDSVTLVKEGENLDQDFLTDDEDNNNINETEEAFVSVLSERAEVEKREGQKEEDKEEDKEDKEEDSNDSMTVLQVCLCVVLCCVAALTPSIIPSQKVQ
jgi:hypothetical protein